MYGPYNNIYLSQIKVLSKFPVPENISTWRSLSIFELALFSIVSNLLVSSITNTIAAFFSFFFLHSLHNWYSNITASPLRLVDSYSAGNIVMTEPGLTCSACFPPPMK